MKPDSKLARLRVDFFQHRGILSRWFTHNFLATLVLFFVAGCSLAASLHGSYYRMTEQRLQEEAAFLEERLLERLAMGDQQSDGYMTYLINEFAASDEVGVQVLDAKGEVLLQSETAARVQKEQALALPAVPTDQPSRIVQRLPQLGRVMVLTEPIAAEGTSYAAFRLVYSLKALDHRLMVWNLELAGGCILLLLLIVGLNFRFIGSVAYPLRSIGHTAKSFASGNLSERIAVQSDDEIGELAVSLNEMADTLQQTEKMQNEFISSVSHELRTPLTAIRGWSETIADPAMRDNDILDKGMAVIIRETNRLSVMVEELLDFSRLQNGRLTIVRVKIDVLAELDSAVMMYTERAKRDKRTLLINEPDHVSPVIGDADRLRQVFINILDNALKYSDEGGTVMVDVKEREGFLIIRISDTGCGIAAEDLPRIKEKFFKANMTRRGSGIGLAVADEIIRMHDGVLSVESQEHIGTTVTIRIPTAPLETDNKPQPEGEEHDHE